VKELNHKEAWGLVCKGIRVFGMIEGRSDSILSCYHRDNVMVDSWMICDYFLADEDHIPDAEKTVDIASHARKFLWSMSNKDASDWAEELARLILVEVDKRIDAATSSYIEDYTKLELRVLDLENELRQESAWIRNEYRADIERAEERIVKRVADAARKATGVYASYFSEAFIRELEKK